MGSIRRSIAFSFLDRNVGQLFAIATMAIMARLLSPAETGLYLLAVGVLTVVDSVRDFGVAAYLIQLPCLSREAVRTAFTVTLALSLSFASALHVSAASLAEQFGDRQLAELLRIGTIGLLVVPIGTPAMALMRREMDFGTLAAVNVVAAATTALTTLALGTFGFGAASYIWGLVAGSAASTIMAIRARPLMWIFWPSLSGCREMLSFGATSSLVMLLNVAFDMLPRFVIGRVLGFDAVGLYGRALTLCQIPERAIVSALSPVVLPAFAVRVRERQELKDAYLRGVTLMAAVQWPILLLVALLAEPIVAVVLGEQWHAAAPLTRVMAIGSMALAPAFLTFPVLVALGRVRDTLAASLISLPPSALLMVSAPRLA